MEMGEFHPACGLRSHGNLNRKRVLVPGVIQSGTGFIFAFNSIDIDRATKSGALIVLNKGISAHGLFENFAPSGRYGEDMHALNL
jgi:hypothetical protein